MNSGGGGIGGGKMSPLHESALFQPTSINDGVRSSDHLRSAKTVFTCKKCGSTDMEEKEEQGEDVKFREQEVKFREESGPADRPTPGKSNDRNRASSRMSSCGSSSSSSPCTNVSDDDDDNEINVVDDEGGETAVAAVEIRQQGAAAPSSSSMSICEQLESMVTRYVIDTTIRRSAETCDCDTSDVDKTV